MTHSDLVVLMTFDNLLLNLMKVLKYNIIAKLIIKKH